MSNIYAIGMQKANKKLFLISYMYFQMLTDKN